MAEGELVLIQTFLLYYVNQVILMLTSIFQEQFPEQSKEGLYQNKVTLTLASIHNCKMAYYGCLVTFYKTRWTEDDLVLLERLDTQNRVAFFNSYFFVFMSHARGYTKM